MVSKNKVEYKLDGQGRFTIENYNRAKAFASFFPGIAGRLGTPMWGYYVNRGQAVSSIGVKNKDHQIMEFLSFNRARELTGLQGFRTFIKIDGSLYEPFKKPDPESNNIRQKMIVDSQEIIIEDINRDDKIKTTVTYFQLSGEKIPALLRKIEVENRGKKSRDIEIIDGLPRILPYGVDRHGVNVIPRHIEGLMKVYDFNGIPTYKLKINPEDKPEIEILKGRNFYFSFTPETGILKNNSYIVDPEAVFGDACEYEIPYNFKNNSVEQVRNSRQIKRNRTPSAFTGISNKLNPEKTLEIYSAVGYAGNTKYLENFMEKFSDRVYYDAKRSEQKQIIDSIKNNMFTVSGSEEFDRYCGQTFLDNILRGGMPVVFDTARGKKAFYLYSRQNGDLERDYHDFVLEPTYYSQGNGHYRCIIQNRRLDNFFIPEVGDSNIKFFLNAMQTDGYNPIEVRSTTFTLKKKEKLKNWLDKNIDPEDIRKDILDITSRQFVPGEIAMAADSSKISIDPEKVAETVLKFSVQNIVIDLHGRLGYWVDHWCYNLDLVESYLRVYPEKLGELLLDEGYTFYDNPDNVLPRDKKYILDNGKVRQYKAVERKEERIHEIDSREEEPRKVRTGYGAGDVYNTNLIVKLLSLIVNRISTLDPENNGYELEANKPGWNDSINGLPGILGSSLCHSLQLQRYCRFLKESLEEIKSGRGETTKIYEELKGFMDRLIPVLNKRMEDSSDAAKFRFWNKSHKIKEDYREKISTGISGKEDDITFEEIQNFLDKCITVLKDIFSKENEDKIFNREGIPYTYFINDATGWEKTGMQDASGNHLVKVKDSRQRPVTPFLEGPVHFLKIYPERAKELYENIRSSRLFDEKLKSYRNNESLEDESYEIGRIKAWGRGWIENESLYTHMLFKYLLELLKSGLYKEFFKDIQNSIMPFLDPEVYGRSILENVSFMVSSAFDDEKMHGQGLQSRLSGSTCEFINMWSIICAGAQPFFKDSEGKLRLSLSPVIPGWLFTQKEKKRKFYTSRTECKEVTVPHNSFGFKFLGKTLVVYKNPSRKATFGNDKAEIKSLKVFFKDGNIEEFKGKILDSETSLAVRKGKVRKIEAQLK